MDFGELVTALGEILGTRLVAYLGGATETQTVRQWADGSVVADPVVLERLRCAYQAARLATAYDSTKVAQTWFQGRNPLLDDLAPAHTLRDGPPERHRWVLAAARQFAAAA